MRATLRFAAITLCLLAFGADLAAAQNQPPPPPQRRDTFKPDEIIHEGHKFFVIHPLPIRRIRRAADGAQRAVGTGHCDGLSM